MSGRVGDLSLEQERILNEFRESVSDIMRNDFDDYFLLRWLRARKFDKNKSEQMLRKHLVWRKANSIDTVLTDYTVPKVLKEYCPKVFIGLDKEGCPVHWFNVGSADFPGIIKCVPYSALMKFWSYQIEGDRIKMQKEESKGRRVETHSFIVEMENISLMRLLKKAVLSTIFRMVVDYEANYPEILKRIYFVNVTQAAIAFYKILKPIFPEDIYRKISLHTPENTKEALLKDMDPEMLPAYLGGSRTDPDGNPRCVTILPPSPKVPEEYYMENTRLQFTKSPNVSKIVIPSRGSYPIEMKIESAERVLQWEFQSLEKDVGFGLLFKGENDDDSLKELIQTTRYECLEGAESGSYICEKPGNYILNFDNSYSWMRQVTVFYRIDIYNPVSIPTKGDD